jgi:hypothetical protein
MVGPIATPDPAVIQWVVETYLGEADSLRAEVAEQVLSAVKREAQAAGLPISDSFSGCLQGILSDEAVISMSDQFVNRLRNLCAQSLADHGTEPVDWKRQGF